MGGIGSSPHTRGAQDPPSGRCRRPRIIPAYAGSTCLFGRSSPPFADHPRIRGEHARKCSSTRFGAGSSPHTRGARQSTIKAAMPLPDHPRIRGEHVEPSEMLTAQNGSSPHTRGAPPLRPVHGGWPGIIPAYAGSTSVMPSWRRRSGGSSPHTRGALVVFRYASRSFRIIPAYAGSTLPGQLRGRDGDGSSPHTRGALPPAPQGREGGGIIPAYAGSTRYRVRPSSRMKDHPRIRGEHISRLCGAGRRRGSSPHTRGALCAQPRIPRNSRIIPAYAGSTRTLYPTMSSTKDHPRIRGEHPSGPSRPGGLTGSSPHTRGAHEIGWKARGWDRIIPAYAGSTA